MMLMTALRWSSSEAPLGEQNNIPDELQQKNFCWYGVRLVFDDTTCYVMKRQDIYNMIQDNFFTWGRCYITKTRNIYHQVSKVVSTFTISITFLTRFNQEMEVMITVVINEERRCGWWWWRRQRWKKKKNIIDSVCPQRQQNRRYR